MAVGAERWSRPNGDFHTAPRRAAAAVTVRRSGEELHRLRVLWLLAAAALLASTVWTRMAYWQISQHGRLSAIAEAQYSKYVDLPSTRGMIYDSSGRPLAVDTTVYDVFVSPSQIPAGQREALAEQLAAALNVPRDPLLGVLSSGKQFAYVAKRVSKTIADRLTALQLPSVGLQPEQQRSYLPGAVPGTSLASNLLGFVNYDGQGQYGVEGYYDQALAGKAGYETTYRDLAGNEIVLGSRTQKLPVNGSSLTLTLDSDIQFAAEQAIAGGVQAAHAESGSVLIMDPHTGGIIAWADYPGYDANQFQSTDVGRFQDPMVSYLYEPGSVMKVVTLAGALEDHAITPTTTINDPGYIGVGGYTLHDWDLASHGTVTMTRVLDDSLNVGAVRAMQMEGSSAFYRNLEAFGFGKPSGVDVLGENRQAAGLAPLDQWSTVQVATTSFGQGIAVNMVQMLSAVNVIANGGRWAQPHVVAAVGDKASAAASVPARQVVTTQTAQLMTSMMEDVVQHGSGWKARVPGFQNDEAGKTGTSQIPQNGGYSDQVWASYVGFLPATNPQFTMLVVVRKPNNGSSDHNEGYYVSGPIWKEIAQAIVVERRLSPEAH
ncbi:MAG TPA: penicillin-binding protein 2 [Candidatus Dormibacteraeota bacterium]